MRGTYDDFDAVVRPFGEPRSDFHGADGFVGHGVVLKGSAGLGPLIRAMESHPFTSGLLGSKLHIEPVGTGDMIIAWRLSEFIKEDRDAD